MSNGWRLYADAGNSNLYWAIHTPDGWHAQGLIPVEELAAAVSLPVASLAADECEGVALVSSSPRNTEAAEDFLRRVSGREVALLGRDIHSRIPPEHHAPEQIGQDRLAVVEGAAAIHGMPVVALTVGTCITAQALSSAGQLVGGIIAPGLPAHLAGLIATTPHLSEQAREAVAILRETGTAPQPARSTSENLAAGLALAVAGTAEALALQTLVTLGEDAPVIATGGDAEIAADHSEVISHVDQMLTLAGLRAVHERALEE